MVYMLLENVICSSLARLLCLHSHRLCRERLLFFFFFFLRFVLFHSVPLAFDHLDKLRQTEKHPPPQQREQNGEWIKLFSLYLRLSLLEAAATVDEIILYCDDMCHFKTVTFWEMKKKP